MGGKSFSASLYAVLNLVNSSKYVRSMSGHGFFPKHRIHALMALEISECVGLLRSTTVFNASCASEENFDRNSVFFFSSTPFFSLSSASGDKYLRSRKKKSNILRRSCSNFSVGDLGRQQRHNIAFTIFRHTCTVLKNI